MLVLSRKENEWIRIEPLAGVDPLLTLRDLFVDGPILVKVLHVGRRVRLVIDAPAALRIWRGSDANPAEVGVRPEPSAALTTPSQDPSP